MNLDQLIKKKENCEKTILKATEEKKQLEQQIKDQTLELTGEHMEKCEIPITELLKLLKKNKERLKAMFDSLGEEEKEKQDDKKEKNPEAGQ